LAVFLIREDIFQVEFSVNWVDGFFGFLLFCEMLYGNNYIMQCRVCVAELSNARRATMQCLHPRINAETGCSVWATFHGVYN